MNTAAGSPSERASVSSSYVTFLGVPSTCSTRTRTSATVFLSRAEHDADSSDELLRREELGELRAAVTLVLDDLPGLLRRPRRKLRHLGGRPAEAYLVGLDARVGERQRRERLLL